MTATARESANHLFAQLGDAVDAAYDEIDRLRARVAELEGPPLTAEQQANVIRLADRLTRASIREKPQSRRFALLLSNLAGNLRSGARFSPGLLNHADKIATELLGEDTDRG